MSLQRGFVVPLAVFNLVLACENAGIRLRVHWERGAEVLKADGPLTPAILTELKQWKPHVIAILKYTGDDRHLFDDAIAPPEYGPMCEVSK
ncbi:MAG: hypothetical protein Q8O42_09440 [Acidobacteriota bacterium]|nr:hypothetical protein [Acidobacteriota bacterium]